LELSLTTTITTNYKLARFLSQSRQKHFKTKKKAAYNLVNKNISKAKIISMKSCLFQFPTIKKYPMLFFVLMIRNALMDILFSIDYMVRSYSKNLP